MENFPKEPLLSLEIRNMENFSKVPPPLKKRDSPSSFKVWTERDSPDTRSDAPWNSPYYLLF
jgi:hypothetical protein